MSSNWSEFDDFLRFAEERGAEVYVNTVTEPYDQSLYHLAPPDLQQVVDEFERRDPMVVPTLSGPRLAAWSDQLERLRHHLLLLAKFEPPDYVARRMRLGFAWLGPVDRARLDNEWLDGVTINAHGAMVEVDSVGVVSSILRIGLEASPEDEWSVDAVLGQLRVGEVAPVVLTGADVPDDGSVARSDRQRLDLSAGADGDGQRHFEIVRVAVRDDHGVVVGARILVVRRLRLGFEWFGAVEDARLENEWFEHVAANAHGTLVEVDSVGVVSSVRRLGSDGFPWVDATIDAVVGELAPAVFTGADDSDDGSAARSDRQRVVLGVTGDGEAAQEFEVVRGAVRDDQGVVVGARIVINSMAYAFAHALAEECEDPAPPIARLGLDERGQIVSVGGDINRVLGVDPASILGLGVDRLDQLVAVGGDVVPLEDLGQAGRVSHHRRAVRLPDGDGWQVHSFSEVLEGLATIWVVRVSDCDERSLS